VTKPTIGELLSGVANSLRELVLPEIPPGTTRRQIQAAIGIIRRVALACDKTGPYLFADNQDIEENLRRILPSLQRAAADEDEARLKAIYAKLRAALEPSPQPAESYPSPDALGGRNVELQGLLAEVQEALHETPAAESADRTEMLSILRALFRRMLQRELEITSPAPAKR